AAVAARLVEERAEYGAPADGLGADDGIRRLLITVGAGRRAVAIGREGGRAGADSDRPRAIPRLPSHQTRVGASAAEQLPVGALFDQAPLVEHEGPVGADDARQSVSEDQSR